MTSGHSDSELVARFLSAVEGMGQREIEGAVPGITHGDVSRWRRGAWKRLSEKKRQALIRFLEAREAGEKAQPWQEAIYERILQELDGRPQVWLARKTGIPQSTLNDQFQRKQFSLEALIKIAHALDVDVGYLIRGGEKRPIVTDVAQAALARVEKVVEEAKRASARKLTPSEVEALFSAVELAAEAIAAQRKKGRGGQRA